MLQCFVRRMWLVFVVVGLIVTTCSFGSVCFAESLTPQTTPQSPVAFASAEPFDMTGSMFRMLGGFLFCLGLFGAGIHLYKKYVMPNAKSDRRRLKIIERLPLSPKNSLILVSLDGRELLLSTGPDSPKMLVAQAKHEQCFDQDLLDATAVSGEYNA